MALKGAVVVFGTIAGSYDAWVDAVRFNFERKYLARSPHSRTSATTPKYRLRGQLLTSRSFRFHADFAALSKTHICAL